MEIFILPGRRLSPVR